MDNCFYFSFGDSSCPIFCFSSILSSSAVERMVLDCENLTSRGVEKKKLTSEYVEGKRIVNFGFSVYTQYNIMQISLFSFISLFKLYTSLWKKKRNYFAELVCSHFTEALHLKQNWEFAVMCLLELVHVLFWCYSPNIIGHDKKFPK